MIKVNRREFIRNGIGGMTAIIVGSRLEWLKEAKAAVIHDIAFEITDVMKEMVTHNAINTAKCYFWIYKSITPDLPAECPGPAIVATAGDTINITVTNSLDEPHAFSIPGIIDSGPITENGGVWSGSFTPTIAGTYLYYDNLNEPVNRVMGLHGALVVMPAAAAAGHKFTPYDPTLVTPGIQKLYDDFGPSAHFPGLAWEEGDSTPWSLDPTKVNCTPFRQYIWLDHQASPKLFAEVGNYTAGLDYPAAEFLEKFNRAPVPTLNASGNSADTGYTPSYFTISGQSGMFSHFSPQVTMMGRVGEPCVVHILNAGLWTHSMHLHANHFFVTFDSKVGGVMENPIWVDVYTVNPMDRIDYTVPFMRPPDIGTPRGIGRPETPLASLNGTPVWPPVEEFEMYMPGPGEDMARDIVGNPIDLEQRMSPLCYPMHDHSEPSQTAQGGNYNCGLISGIYFTGDRNGMMDFPMDEDFQMAYQNIRGISATGPAAPPLGAPVM